MRILIMCASKDGITFVERIVSGDADVEGVIDEIQKEIGNLYWATYQLESDSDSGHTKGWKAEDARADFAQYVAWRISNHI